MEITTAEGFLKYLDSVRGRTLLVIKRIPPDRIEWTHQPGKWTFGNLIRHLGALERWMWAENVAGRPSRYRGCGVDLAEGYDEVVAYFGRMHGESIPIFGSLSDEDLRGKCMTPAGVQMTTWKWLRAMIEHEIHHRGQMFTYLSILGVDPGALFGLTSEQVAERGVE